MSRNGYVKRRCIMVVLGIIIFTGAFSPRPASTCELLKQFIYAYQELYDPPIPFWIKPNEFWLGTETEDYDYLGMTAGAPEIWEDGLRTDPDSFSFEWWYYDAHFIDGSSVVLGYSTKHMYTPGAPTTPLVTVTIVTPDGEIIKKEYETTAEDASFAKDSCDVQIGDNYIYGDLDSYTIYAEIDDVVVDLNMERLVPSWRPGTGHLFFEDQDTYFAWLPAVPNGNATGTLTYKGETHEVNGSGYHDHNWGITSVPDHIKYWWWSRSQVGPYTIIAVNQRLKNVYGNDSWLPVFVILDENGALIDEALPDVTMTHEESDIQDHPEPDHRGQIANTVTFRAEKENGDWAEIRLEADQLLETFSLLTVAGLSDIEIFFAKLLGKDPWYTRFGCTATLSFSIDGVEYEDTGFSTLELMDME